MHTRTLRVYAALAASLCLGVRSWAQPEDNSELRIEVKSDSVLLLSGYTAVIEGVGPLRYSQTADVELDGRIEYRGVPPGEYQLKILDPRNNLVTSELVTVSSGAGPLSVRLPTANVPRPPSGGVSVTELQHPPARKAVEAALAAQRSAESGDYARAAAQLQKAIRISPDFAAAYTNLAAQHVRLRLYRPAIEESAKAMQIAGANPRDLTNMAAAQASLGRFADAIQSLRAALRIDPAFPAANYVLGSLLVRDPPTRTEGVTHLRQAAPAMAGARALLEKVQ